jgi:galactokinase
MDQMAASLGDRTAALFLDTLTLDYERLPLPPDSALLVIHSGITHDHASGEYRVRRTECDTAARRLGVARLRDVTLSDLTHLALPAPLDRRVRHVVTENARVLAARDALEQGDARRLGELMNASHASMRDDFEISTPEIDRLVSIAQHERDVFGARLTGGGFGGCIVALAQESHARDTARRIADSYARGARARPAVLIP